MNPNPLLGKKIIAVDLTVDGSAIRFHIEGGEIITAIADGDCCSQSWIENVETPENILGTVVSAEDIDLSKPDEEVDYEVIRFYGFKITTEKGSSLLDYRNSSNGYYGGSLVWPGDHYYGGVYGQNSIKEEWKKLV